MRVSREQMKEHRERVLTAAAELFRERGFDGVGIAEIMAAAGMTHGGFYRHFGSKDELAAQACGRAFGEALERLERKRGDLARYTDSYLTERHRDRPGSGCPIACFAADVDKTTGPVREQFVGGLARYLDRLAESLPRERAVALVASLVGALLLARATATDAPRLSSEILASMRGALADAERAARRRPNAGRS
jgi:TetR/AcrR family transcriptional regulator, transcriptional repressor for nem operon